MAADKSRRKEMKTRRLCLREWVVCTQVCASVCVCVRWFAPASLGGNICCRVSEATCRPPSGLTGLSCAAWSCSRMMCTRRNSCLLGQRRGRSLFARREERTEWVVMPIGVLQCDFTIWKRGKIVTRNVTKSSSDPRRRRREDINMHSDYQQLIWRSISFLGAEISQRPPDVSPPHRVHGSQRMYPSDCRVPLTSPSSATIWFTVVGLECDVWIIMTCSWGVCLGGLS